MDVIRGFLKPEFLASGPMRPVVLSTVRDMAESLGPEVFLRQIKTLQRRRDQQAVLRKAKVPALVVCGAYDGLTSVKRHEFMAELIPYAKLAVLQDAGHLPTLEAPDQVNALLTEWLRQPNVLRS